MRISMIVVAAVLVTAPAQAQWSGHNRSDDDGGPRFGACDFGNCAVREDDGRIFAPQRPHAEDQYRERGFGPLGPVQGSDYGFGRNGARYR